MRFSSIDLATGSLLPRPLAGEVGTKCRERALSSGRVFVVEAPSPQPSPAGGGGSAPPSRLIIQGPADGEIGVRACCQPAVSRVIADRASLFHVGRTRPIF